MDDDHFDPMAASFSADSQRDLAADLMSASAFGFRAPSEPLRSAIQDEEDEEDEDWEVVKMTRAMRSAAGMVVAYEHQRFWPLGGWLPLMYRSDPPAWSDASHTAYAPLGSFMLPVGANGCARWVWTSMWMVDMSMRGFGAPASGYRETNEDEFVIGAIDVDGWEYSDRPQNPYGYQYQLDGATHREFAAPLSTLPPHKFPLRRRKWVRNRERTVESLPGYRPVKVDKMQKFKDGLGKGFGLMKTGVMKGFSFLSNKAKKAKETAQLTASLSRVKLPNGANEARKAPVTTIAAAVPPQVADRAPRPYADADNRSSVPTAATPDAESIPGLEPQPHLLPSRKEQLQTVGPVCPHLSRHNCLLAVEN